MTEAAPEVTAIVTEAAVVTQIVAETTETTVVAEQFSLTIASEAPQVTAPEETPAAETVTEPAPAEMPAQETTEVVADEPAVTDIVTAEPAAPVAAAEPEAITEPEVIAEPEVITEPEPVVIAEPVTAPVAAPVTETTVVVAGRHAYSPMTKAPAPATTGEAFAITEYQREAGEAYSLHGAGGHAATNHAASEPSKTLL